MNFSLTRPVADKATREPIAEIIRENVFTPYRARILYPIAAAAIPVLLPFGVYHVLEGHGFLGGLLLVTMVLLALDTSAVHHGRRPPIPFPLLLLAAAATVAVQITVQGLPAAIWAFPVAMFAYFTLSRRAANITSLTMLLVCTALLFNFADAGAAVRFLLALGLCILAANLHVNVLDAVHSRLTAQSLTDPLTGAFNRRHMDTCLGHVDERHRRSGATASLLLIDIDRFRHVNDRYGQDVGDRCLRSFVERVRGCARKPDLLFRVAGDKFALLLPDTHASEAAILAEHIRANVANGTTGASSVTVSIGVAEIAEGADAANWLALARNALESAKGDGRNRVR